MMRGRCLETCLVANQILYLFLQTYIGIMPIFKVAYMIFDALKTQLAVNLFIDTQLNLKKFL